MDKIAVLISTRNRNAYLSCLLNYYSKINFRHKIYVGDASDYDIHIIMNNKIKKIYSNLDIQYVYFPNYNNGITDNLKVIERLSELVTEKFIAVTGDDDFLIPEMIDKCINYLNDDDSYISINGNGKFIIYDEELQKSLITGEYTIRGFEQNTGLERLREISENYSVLTFGVIKTINFKKACRDINLLDDPILNELYLIFSLAIQGKTKQINEIYLVRGIHYGRNILENQVHSMLKKKWHESYRKLNEKLAMLLVEYDEINPVNACENVDYIVNKFIENKIINDVKKYYSRISIFRLLITQIKLTLLGKILRNIKVMFIDYKAKNKEYILIKKEWNQLFDNSK